MRKSAARLDPRPQRQRLRRVPPRTKVEKAASNSPHHWLN